LSIKTGFSLFGEPSGTRKCGGKKVKSSMERRQPTGSHAEKKKSGPAAFTQTCMHACPPPFVHSWHIYHHHSITTTTTTTINRPGRDGPPSRVSTQPTSHTHSPAPSSSPCCNQQQQQQHSSNHGRPLRAHAGALQVRLHLCTISSLCCLPVCAPFVFFFAPKPHHFSASHHPCPFHVPHHLPLPLSLLLPKPARSSRRIN